MSSPMLPMRRLPVMPVPLRVLKCTQTPYSLPRCAGLRCLFGLESAGEHSSAAEGLPSREVYSRHWNRMGARLVRTPNFLFVLFDDFAGFFPFTHQLRNL